MSNSSDIIWVVTVMDNTNCRFLSTAKAANPDDACGMVNENWKQFRIVKVRRYVPPRKKI